LHDEGKNLCEEIGLAVLGEIASQHAAATRKFCLLLRNHEPQKFGALK